MIEVERIAELSGHQNPIFTIEPSVKPGIIFTAGNDKGVVEWSLKKMDFIKVMFPVQTSVYALHCPDFKPLLISGERSGLVTIFDFIEQKVTAKLQHHQLPIFDIKSIKSKNELLLASEDGTVSVWDLNSYKILYNFKVSSEIVRVIAVSPDEKIVAFGCKDNTISVFNLEDYSFVEKLTQHTMPVTALQFSPDGMYLLSGSRDAQLKVWKLVNFSILHSLPAHLFSIYDIKFHPSKPIFATASRDKTIKIWDSETFKLLKTISREKGYPTHKLSINKICWDIETGNLLTTGDDKLIMIWQVTVD